MAEPTRRAFFRRGGGAVLSAGMLPLLSAPSTAADAVFRHGVASGDPLADRVILWTRISGVTGDPPVRVQCVVATDPEMKHEVLRRTVRTGPSQDYTVKLDASGLAPGQTFYYRFNALGSDSPIGRTRTLPVGATARLRLAVASCSNHAAGLFNAYARIAERADLDLVLHLGDYIYEYGTAQYGSLRDTDPPFELLTLGDYRRRHAQYKTDADLQALHRQHPVVPIWDDHEVANDAWRGGAQNHDPATEGLWSSRRARALQAYYEWMPVREPAKRRQAQRSFRLGDLAEVVMLEERLQARDEQLPAPLPVPGLGQGFKLTGRYLDPSRSMLGSEQEAWLDDTLRRSPARWKLVGQGVMFAQLKAVGRPNAEGGGVFVNPDQWDGYPLSRERVFDSLAATDNVVVLTGDIHSAWANDLARDPNNPDPAAGGYDPATGQGALAVEFVTTSITSPGVADADGTLAGIVRAQNPHVRHVDLQHQGYLLLDITPERVVGEHWSVDTVLAPSQVQTLTAVHEVQSGSRRLVPSAPTAARDDAPPLAR